MPSRRRRRHEHNFQESTLCGLADFGSLVVKQGPQRPGEEFSHGRLLGHSRYVLEEYRRGTTDRP